VPLIGHVTGQRAPRAAWPVGAWSSRRRALLAFTISWLALLIGCAPSFSDGFERSRAAAIRAYSSGRYVEAAANWERVAAEAPDRHQKYEALYRAASAYKRGRRPEQAKATYARILKEAPKTDRAARAAYDLADLELEAGDDEAGFKGLERVLDSYPDSGSAPAALKRCVLWLEDTKGDAAAKAWLTERISRQQSTALGEHLHYALAKLLVRMDEPRAALTRYLYVAQRYPYPSGALWDDSLFHASQLEEQLGNPQRAVEHLERMLKEREPSSMPGSYERPRYSESQYRIGVLQRDALKQPAAAIRAFRSLRLEFTTSILRDDAAWQEAKLSASQGDQAGACQAMRWLREEIPDSRYAACGQLLCTQLKPLKRECRSYIQRELAPSQLHQRLESGP